jgi:hypothetical protein
LAETETEGGPVVPVPMSWACPVAADVQIDCRDTVGFFGDGDAKPARIIGLG